MSHREKSDDISACRGYFSAYGVKPGHDAVGENSSAKLSTYGIKSGGKQSRLMDCGSNLVWIASLSLAMTAEGDEV